MRPPIILSDATGRRLDRRPSLARGVVLFLLMIGVPTACSAAVAMVWTRWFQ